MRRTLLATALGAALVIPALLAGCEDDGGAPAWKAGLDDGGRVVTAADAAPAGDAATGGDAGLRDAGGGN